MVGSIDIKLNAAAPQLPLLPVFAHVGSPSSIRLLNVPKKIGAWEITAVQLTFAYPDNSTPSVQAVKSGGVWTATIRGASAPGMTEHGVTVTADGIDENGEPVYGYVLGEGDLMILDRDSTLHPGVATHYLHLIEAKPTEAHKGDVVHTDDGWEIFDGSAWIGFGGGGSGSGATVLTTNGSKIFKGGVEMTSYTALLALVQAGGVTLMGTVGADKDALYYPLFCGDIAIRFDATVTLGGDVKTKSYTVQPENGDSIRVSVGDVDLAKKSDIPDVSGFAADHFVGTVARTGKESEIKNAAIISEMTIPISVLNGIKKLVGFRLRCANSSSGTWASSVWFSVFARSSSGATALIGRTGVGSMRVGEYTDFAISNPVTIPNGAVEIFLTASAATRIALANTVENYLLRGSTGSTITGYKPIIDLSAEMTISDALQLLADRSLEPTGGVAANVNLTAPDGTRWALGVNNDGTLYTTIPDASAASDEEDIEIE